MPQIQVIALMIKDKIQKTLIMASKNIASTAATKAASTPSFTIIGSNKKGLTQAKC